MFSGFMYVYNLRFCIDSCSARPIFISYRPLIYAKTTVLITPRMKLDHRSGAPIGAPTERCYLTFSVQFRFDRRCKQTGRLITFGRKAS